MNRRIFLLTSSTLLVLPLDIALAQEVCLKGLEGIDVESHDSPGYTHYHQLILPVSHLVMPPQNGIQLKTSAVDQGSYDVAGLEAFAKNINTDIKALKAHDHEVFISRDELLRIAAGEENVEIAVLARDKKTYVHNFFVTAPPSALAIVKKESK
ncbi:MAG: hypothetical protein IT287_04585 [Bdellovibrionaceae bacterium]|nr:hypothetical protein [Pseudobdellovibrionaceae bacterium]